MRTIWVALSLAAGIGLVCSQNALAAPVGGVSLKEAATAAAILKPAQYYERHTRRGIIKCYREFVIGPYRCHRYW